MIGFMGCHTPGTAKGNQKTFGAPKSSVSHPEKRRESNRETKENLLKRARKSWRGLSRLGTQTGCFIPFRIEHLEGGFTIYLQCWMDIEIPSGIQEVCPIAWENSRDQSHWSKLSRV